jgi:hypothetical protein
LRKIYLSFIPPNDFKIFKIARTGAVDDIFTPGQTVKGAIEIMHKRVGGGKESGASSKTLAHSEVQKFIPGSVQPVEAAASSSPATPGKSTSK